MKKESLILLPVAFALISFFIVLALICQTIWLKGQAVGYEQGYKDGHFIGERDSRNDIFTPCHNKSGWEISIVAGSDIVDCKDVKNLPALPAHYDGAGLDTIPYSNY